MSASLLPFAAGDAVQWRGASAVVLWVRGERAAVLRDDGVVSLMTVDELRVEQFPEGDAA